MVILLSRFRNPEHHLRCLKKRWSYEYWILVRADAILYEKRWSKQDQINRHSQGQTKKNLRLVFFLNFLSSPLLLLHPCRESQDSSTGETEILFVVSECLVVVFSTRCILSFGVCFVLFCFFEMTLVGCPRSIWWFNPLPRNQNFGPL